MEVLSVNERRLEILRILNMRRFETIPNLANEFKVSTRTICSDIKVLSCTTPIYTIQGNGGGVYVDENYYFGKQYLSVIQELYLRELSDKVDDTGAEIIQSILDNFAMPRRMRDYVWDFCDA